MTLHYKIVEVEKNKGWLLKCLGPVYMEKCFSKYKEAKSYALELKNALLESGGTC